jgi:endo-1,4-beta-xylanase
MTAAEVWTRRQLVQAVGPVAVLANTSEGLERGGRVALVRAFDPSGSPAPNDLLSTFLLVNPASRPFEVVPQPKGDGSATIGMPKERFDLAMVLPVRGFGQVYLHSDNAGAHYSAAQVDGRGLLLNYEFARSRAGFVRRYVKSGQAEGVNFSSGMMSRLEQGEAALARATAARETGARVGHSNDSLAETMWAGEMAALERARHRIAGQDPRPGFLFGAAAFGYAKSEEYARQYSALLNYGTVPFYRAATERVEGSPDYRNVEAILEKLAGTHIITKGHPLVWFHRAGIPEFLKSKPWDELKRSCRAYILRSVGRFRSRIHAWDVINEAHDWANELGFNQDQLLEITRLAAESTRVADPTAFRVINCCLPWGEYVATGRTYAGPLKRPARTPLEYYRAVEDAHVPYECIGIQVYYPGQDMLEIERQLERFFVFGKPIHITELGVPTSSQGVKGGGGLPYEHVWHGTAWSEAIQADWAEQFYTICYSKPEIQAISWWTFADSSRPGSGLLHSDLRPKESYLRLAKLLASWKQA